MNVTAVRRPTKVSEAQVTFTGENPLEILRGPSWDYVSETLTSLRITMPPAQAGTETVTIVEVTGLSMYMAFNSLGRSKEFRLASMGETVEIAEQQRGIQGMGKFFVLGNKYSIQGHTHSLYLYLDDDMASTGDEGRSSHMAMMDAEDYEHRSLGDGTRAFVAIIGVCPRWVQ